MSYARGTVVSVERSRMELERVMLAHGAAGFQYTYVQRTEGAKVWTSWYVGRAIDAPVTRDVYQISFIVKGRHIRIDLPMPHPKELKFRSSRETEEGRAARAEQGQRERWRLLVLVVKAKLEAVAAGLSTFEEEFLANVVMKNGMTIGQGMLHRLPEVVETGRLLTAGEGAPGHGG